MAEFSPNGDDDDAGEDEASAGELPFRQGLFEVRPGDSHDEDEVEADKQGVGEGEVGDAQQGDPQQLLGAVGGHTADDCWLEQRPWQLPEIHGVLDGVSGASGAGGTFIAVAADSPQPQQGVSQGGEGRDGDDEYYPGGGLHLSFPSTRGSLALEASVPSPSPDAAATASAALPAGLK